MTKTTKFAIAYFLVYALGFAALWSYLSTNALIMILNGFFVGSILSAVLAFRPLLYNAFMGRLKHPDAGQFALGLFMLLLGIVFGVLSSVYIRGVGIVVPSIALTALARYTTIHGLVLLIYAPDFGLGLFEGRDRKLTVLALGAGFLVAMVVIYIQAVEFFA